MKFNYGHFNEENEFVITEPDIPRNWYNYLFSDHYITFTSQVGAGEGFLQDRLGNRLRLVDDRAVYVVENGNFFLHAQPRLFGHSRQEERHLDRLRSVCAEDRRSLYRL